MPDTIPTPEELAKEAQRTISWLEGLLPKQAAAYRRTDRYILAAGYFAMRAECDYWKAEYEGAVIMHKQARAERDQALEAVRVLYLTLKRHNQRDGSVSYSEAKDVLAHPAVVAARKMQEEKER